MYNITTKLRTSLPSLRGGARAASAARGRGFLSVRGRGFCFGLLLLLFLSCGSNAYDPIGSTGNTVRTENVQRNLLAYEEQGAMLGQMYATAEGIGWMGDSCRSDLHEVTGDHPAVIGYELAGIERGRAQNTDGIDTALIRRTAIEFMHRQGLAVMLWTAPCPGASPFEDGSPANAKLKAWTMRIAAFLGSLHDGYGIKLPTLVYLYPAGTGQWYDRLSADDYRRLYAMTAEWLHDDGKTTNAIFGFSNTVVQGTASDFVSRCPTEGVDCIQLMYLASADPSYGARLMHMARELSAYCSSAMKPLGIYTGLKTMGGDSEFWSKWLLPVVEQCRMSYLMLGRNHGDFGQGCYYGPYPGNASTADFLKLYNSRRTIMARGLNGLWLRKDGGVE